MRLTTGAEQLVLLGGAVIRLGKCPGAIKAAASAIESGVAGDGEVLVEPVTIAIQAHHTECHVFYRLTECQRLRARILQPDDVGACWAVSHHGTCVRRWATRPIIGTARGLHASPALWVAVHHSDNTAINGH